MGNKLDLTSRNNTTVAMVVNKLVAAPCEGSAHDIHFLDKSYELYRE